MATPTSSKRAHAPFFAHTVLIQAITFVLRPTAIYQAISLDVPTQWLGALGASFAVVPLLLAVPTGQVVDRFGEKRVMLLGAVLTLASATYFVVAADTVTGLLIACVLLGTGHLGAVVGQQAMVANRTEPSRYDTAFGHYTFAASAGQAVGPGLIVLFGGHAPIPDTHTIFVWAAGLAVALLLVSLVLPGSERWLVEAGGGSDTGSMRTLLRRRGLIRALSVSCVVLAAVDISLVYLPALGAERGIAAGAIGVILAVRAGASMVSRLFLGRFVRLVGRARLLTGSVVLSAVGMALLPVPMPVWLLGVLVAATGLGLGAGQPLTMSWLAESTPLGLRGRTMSLRLTGNRLGQVIVPTLAGLVAVGAGAAGVLWFTAAALGAVALSSRHISENTPPTPAS